MGISAVRLVVTLAGHGGVNGQIHAPSELTVAPSFAYGTASGARKRTAFAKTKESREIDRLIDRMPEPPVGPERREYSGKFNVRVPKSLHAALASEAEAEGVSLNQLVVAKLALHLQTR